MIMSRKHLDASFDLYISINNTKIFPCMFFFCFLLYCRLSWLPHVAAKRALHWWSIALELRVDVIKEE